MADVPYRDDFPLASITRAVAMLRAGEVLAHPNEFAFHGYQVQSYAQGKLLPYAPDGNITPIGMPVLAAEHEAPLRELVDELAAQPVGAAVGADPFGLGNWITLLLPLLLELLKRFFPTPTP